MKQVFSHRNGETEPPTIRGKYFYQGKDMEDGDGEPTTFERLYTVSENVNDKTSQRWWAFKWPYDPRDRARDTGKMGGKWWGPLILPWEDNA